MRNDSNRLLKHKLHLQSCQTRRVDWCYRRADWCYTIMVNFECRPLPTIHSCIANSAYCLYIKGTVPHISFPRLSFQLSPVYRPSQSLLRIRYSISNVYSTIHNKSAHLLQRQCYRWSWPNISSQSPLSSYLLLALGSLVLLAHVGEKLKLYTGIGRSADSKQDCAHTSSISFLAFVDRRKGNFVSSPSAPIDSAATTTYPRSFSHAQRWKLLLTQLVQRQKIH